MDYNIVSIQKADYDYSKQGTIKKHELNQIFLYVKFNIPVKASSINSESAFISDEFKNILASIVSYDVTKNMLVVSADEQVFENEVYYLNISNNIKSINNKALKNDVRFRFTIKDGKPSGFLAIKGKQAISPSLGGTRKADKADVSIIDKIDINSLPYKRDRKLITIRNYDSVLIGVALILTFTMSSLAGYDTGYILSAILCILFVLLVLKNTCTNRGRAIIEYNKGVKQYNANNYKDALIHFEKSLVYDSTNIHSRVAMEIVFAKSLSSDMQ